VPTSGVPQQSLDQFDSDYRAFSFLGKNALKCAGIDSFLLTLPTAFGGFDGLRG